MKHTKQIMSAVLVFCTLLSLFCLSVSADYTQQSGTYNGFTYIIKSDGTLNISGNGDMTGFENQFGKSFFSTLNITPINAYLGYEVTGIGSGSFKGCDFLSSVTMKTQSPVTLYADAFADTPRLTVLNLNSTVTVKSYAFRDSVFSNIALSQGSSVESYGFAGAKLLKSVTLPTDMMRINAGTFSGCSSLKSITLPAFVSAIKENSFYGCSSLTSITLDTAVASIGDNAFYGCTSLGQVTFAGKKTTIASTAFDGCSSVRFVCYKGSTADLYAREHNIPCTYFGIGTDCPHTDTEWVVMAESTATAHGYKYLFCVDCDEVLDEELLPLLDSNIVSGALTDTLSWRIDSNYILHIEGQGAMPDLAAKEDYPWFDYHNKILGVTLNEGITHIGDYSLSYLPKVTEIDIPDSVESIGLRAFRYTQGMTDVSFGTGVEFVDEYAFQNCDALTNVHISDTSAWCGIEFANQNSTPLNQAENIYLNGELLTELTVPAEVKEIKPYAFINYNKLTKVTIHNGVESIGQKAFRNCYALTEAYIPSSVSAIDISSFANCSSLNLTCDKGSYAESFAESNNIPCTAVIKTPCVESIDNYTVTIGNITDIKEIRFAIGTYTNGSEVKAAEKNVTLDASTVKKYTVNGVFTYDLPWTGSYTFWVRTNGGTSHFFYADVENIIPYTESYGVKLTVKDYAENYKDMWIAEGSFNSYSEIKASKGFKYQASQGKLDLYAKTTHDFSYTLTNPGPYTVLIRYNDGSTDVIHHTLTVDYPEFTENGLQVTLANIPDIKIIRTAYGHYTSVGDIKKASGVRNFSNKNDIKNAPSYMIQYREEGEVTLVVEYNNGYKHFYYYNVEKKVPVMAQNGNTVTFGDLDDLYIIRYAPGKYTTASNIKNAPGSKYLKSDSIDANGEIVIENLTAGRWSFMVQYNDESYNFYVIDIA